MRTLRYLIYALIAICLVVIGFANRGAVTLTLLPDDLVPFTKFNYGIDLPLYIVIFASILVGFALGEVFEWLRESKYRSEAMRERRERALLAREVETLKKKDKKSSDDVLALIE